jgi:eukaryotic-like serine/threonine-protein kinase
MAKEPNAPKAVAKKPPAKPPNPAAEPKAASTASPTKSKPAPAKKPAAAAGQTLRKEPLSDAATDALMLETMGLDMTADEPAEPKPLDQTMALDMPPDEPAPELPQEQPHDQTQALNMSAEELAEPEPPPPPKPAPPASADKGASVLGDYKLLKKLGEGGMGAVYKAHHANLDRVVAIKVLAKQLIKKKEFVLRFHREARVMAKLDHPNVLRCIDVKETPAGIPYIVMEFVDGGSVEGWLKKLGQFSVGDSMHIVLKTAHALQHAHEKSLIHRDIKPDNLLLTKTGIIKVADLGLAKDTDDDVSLTKSGAGAGTPIYMAPEQAYNVKHCDARVDIYALGVMLYVFLTGHPPFQGGTAIELIMAKEKGKFDPIRKYNDEVPPKLDLIVDKMLAKDPKFRFATCQEVIDELEPLGLANDELSFMAPPTGEDPATVPNTKRAAKPVPTKTPAAAAKVSPKTNVNAAAKTPAAKTPVPQEDAEPIEKDVWYWNLVTPQGKAVTKKVTTAQLHTLIKAGHLDATAQVSKTAKAGFRAAATFPEFQALFKSRETSTKANVKGHKYRDQYKEIEAADARRRRWGWLTKSFKGVGGMLVGLLWIVLILAIIGGGGYLAWTYLR